VRFTSSPLAVVAALASTLALAVPARAESVGEKIVEKCGHHEPLGGYTQHQYEEALKDLATATNEYSTCESEIRNAELAAAGSGTGTAAASGGGAALPLTPIEQRAVQSAHRHGSPPVQVGGEPIRPGVVKANVASAVNSLPHSLFALLALLAAAALTGAGWEVRKRVRARGDG
jgi:cobalamin biosynthesis Mg chelatase CobN